MDEELISKKDLLKLTAISYGQLYRWKRKGLIPEEWFIKKSSYTGQETFFPRDKILDRVKKIMDMKEDLSLDDLAETFSPKSSELKLPQDEIIRNNIVSQNVLQIFIEEADEKGIYEFQDILFMSIMEEYLISGEVSLEETKHILKNLMQNFMQFKDRDCDIVFIRRMGVGISLLLQAHGEIYMDNLSKMVLRINIGKHIEKLKIKFS
ncbi:YhbD family protein [Clostridium sp. 19966]|uniref:YhbD family protein n=1 Tax=Clostridium sp. 19966 TaxID=2768166 RepID=UPI0028E03D5A|nr:YhbD family protein [Clostridium sp. 19966]MDT8715878.1 YhbD family protein [Clostridium sp. 19966]